MREEAPEEPVVQPPKYPFMDGADVGNSFEAKIERERAER